MNKILRFFNDCSKTVNKLMIQYLPSFTIQIILYVIFRLIINSMEGSLNHFSLSFTDIQCLGNIEKELFSLEISSKSFKNRLTFGSCLQVPACEAVVSLRKVNEVVGETIVDIDENLNAWIPIPPSYQIKLIGSVSAHPKKLAISVGPPPVSKCSYIKKLQQLESSEREVQAKMTETYFTLPSQYQDVFGKNVSISPGKGFFRKRTLDIVNPNSSIPDFEFSGYFDVSISNISSSELDILQHLAIGLLTRKKDLEFQLEEIELHKEVLSDFDFFIKSLGESMVETKGQSEEESVKMHEAEANLASEINEILSETQRVESKIEDLNAEVSVLRESCAELKRQNESKSGKQDLKSSQDLRKELNKSLKDIEKIEQAYESEMQKFNKDYPDKEYASAVNTKIISLAELQRLVNLRDMELQENIKLQSEVCFLQAQAEINSGLNEITSKAQEVGQDIERVLGKSRQEFCELERARKENLGQSEKEILGVENSLKPVKESIEGSTRVLKEKGESLKELQVKLENMENEKKAVLARTPAKISREEFMHNLEKIMHNDARIRSNLTVELEFLSNLLVKNATSSLQTQRVFRYVEHYLEVQGLQHKSIVNIISNMKDKNPLFSSSKNNPINSALNKVLGKN